MEALAAGCRVTVIVVIASALVPVKVEGGQTLVGGDLFGPTPETTRPVSTAAVSVYGGAGDATGVDAAPIDPLLGGAFYTGFLGGLSHRRRGSRHDFTAAAGTSYRYFPETRELLNLEGAGGATLGSRIGERSRLVLRQTAQYTRFRQLGLVPSSSNEPEGDSDLPTSSPEVSATVGQPFYDLTSSATFIQPFGPRSSLWADYIYRVNLNSEWAERPTTHEARVRYQRGATRRTSYFLGTAYRTGQTGFESGTPTIRANDFEGGFGYSRRTTSISGSGGVTLVSRADLATNPSGGVSDYTVVGAVAVSRQIRDSWSVQLDYSRRLQFVDAFPDPFAADQANAMLSAQWGRRVSLSLRGSYWTGTAVSTTASLDQRVDGWQGSARLGFGVSRWSQGYILYNYTANQFSEGALASLPPGVLPRTNWGGVRAGFTMWAAYVH